VGTLREVKIAADIVSTAGCWPLTGVIELSLEGGAEGVTVTPLLGTDKLRSILTHSSGSSMSGSDGRAHAYLSWATRLSQEVEVHRVTRPTDGWHLDAVVDAVCGLVDAH
jgi:hypothetical protein